MSRKDKVTQAFDADMLRRICTMEEHEFAGFDNAVRVDFRPDRQVEQFYFFIDNGADVLAVAHLDNVCVTRMCEITDTAAGPMVTSPALDDRLGAYVILDLLPKLGLNVDVLLTTGEESCSSSARHFDPKRHHDRQYNWMIEFDRGGMDVVLYQYDSPELRELVKGTGAPVGIGSYSDIADLEHLGCAGMNWGVGYHDYHGPRAHAWLRDTFRMVARFWRFYDANVGTFLSHDGGWGEMFDPDEPGYFGWCLCGEPFINEDQDCAECDQYWLERHGA